MARIQGSCIGRVKRPVSASTIRCASNVPIRPTLANPVHRFPRSDVAAASPKIYGICSPLVRRAFPARTTECRLPEWQPDHRNPWPPSAICAWRIRMPAVAATATGGPLPVGRSPVNTITYPGFLSRDRSQRGTTGFPSAESDNRGGEAVASRLHAATGALAPVAGPRRASVLEDRRSSISPGAPCPRRDRVCRCGGDLLPRAG